MRDQTEITQMFLAAGFKLARRGGHPIWRCPCGHAQISAPSTPGGGNRSRPNTKSLLARTARACSQKRST